MTYVRVLALLFGSTLLLAAPAGAEDPAPTEGPEVVRGGAEFQALAAMPSAERTGVETALIFTNVGGSEFRVLCVAYDAEGSPIGHAWMRIPERGMRFLLASDLSAGTDFAGPVECLALGRVVPSGLLLTPSGISDVSSERYHGVHADFVRFPLAASH